LAPTPLPYRWEVDEDTVTISVSYGPLDATFKSAFSEEGQRFGGGWRPNPGAEETVNVPYDIGGQRVKGTRQLPGSATPRMWISVLGAHVYL
jgi:hypothetical protein